MADEWKWVLGIIAVVTIAMVFTGHLKGNVQFQGVIGVDCPVFKTNAVSLADFGTTTTWVAVDCDNNGIYEAYGMDPSAATSWIFTAKGTAITGYEYMCKTAGFPAYNYVVVKKIGNTYYNAFRQNYGVASSADTTCVGTCTPNCVGKCGGVSDGCSGTCNAVCATTAFVCDTNGDGKINEDELKTTANKWIGG